MHTILDGNLDVVEEHFVHLVFAVHEDQGTYGNARGTHIDQQKRNAVLLALGRRRRANKAENPVGEMRGGCPDLLAVDDVPIAVTDGGRPQRSQIRSRAGLGIPLAPERVAAVDRPQKPFLLRLRSELEKHRRAHQKAERNERWRARITARFVENVPLDDVPVGAAPLLRPRRRNPTLLRENRVPALQIVPRQMPILEDLLPQVRWQMITQPFADLIAKSALFDRIVEIHLRTASRRVGRVSEAALRSSEPECLLSRPCKRRDDRAAAPSMPKADHERPPIV